MDALKNFEGSWVLDPESCEYGEVPAPTAGIYEIFLRDGAALFRIRWVDAEGVTRFVSFSIPPDGARHTIGEGVEASAWVEDGVFITEAFVKDQAGRRVSRSLVEGGAVMRVAQALGGGGELSAEYRRMERVKQVIVYRRDLKMRKGKIAAQVAHASMKVFFDRDEGTVDRLSIPLDAPMAVWSRGQFAKVVLSVEDEAALLRVYAEAQMRGLPSSLVMDSGRTEFHGVPTRTTVAIGPAEVSKIDAITGRDGVVATKLA